MFADYLDEKMGLKLGDTVPDFSAETTEGTIDSFHQWVGDSWTILFSHPADFTPVCTTELTRVTQLSADFAARGVKLIALSCDDVNKHLLWTTDIIHFGKLDTTTALPFPVIADPSRSLAQKFGMLDAKAKTRKGLPLPCRAVFVIGPDKTLKLSTLYPATTGRSFTEILRAVDSLLLTDKHPVATPAEWKPGDDCMVQPLIGNDQLASLFPSGVRHVELPSGKPYLRYTSPPTATQPNNQNADIQ